MEALWWLKRFNRQYSDIEICENNLKWIANGEEQQMPVTVIDEMGEQDFLSNESSEDLGLHYAEKAGRVE